MNVERENDLLKLKVERLEKDIANIRKKLDSTLDQLDKANVLHDRPLTAEEAIEEREAFNYSYR